MSFLSRLAVLLIGGALVFIGWTGWQRLPDWHKPWTPLAFDDPPSWLTRFKLQRLDANACVSLLAATPFQFEKLPDRDTAGGCQLRDVIRVDHTALQIGAALTLSCRTAVSLALWERHVVLPAAQQQFGQPVKRLEHLGSLACRNVYGREDGRRSQHASADAVDVAGFVFADGRRASVIRHWNTDGAESRFLHQVQAGACGYFDGVFSPDYNAAHADHLHLDRGPYRLCR